VNPKSGRLQTRIARYIAFAVVASLVLSLLVLVVFRHRFVQRNMENSAQTYALLVSERLVDQVAFLGIEGRSILEQEVAELRRLNPDIERLEVVDVRGRVLLFGDEGSVAVYGAGGNSPVVTDPDLVRAVSGLETTAARVTGIGVDTPSTVPV
jgi:hypothetical protein